jgi:hypothetical protein
MTFIPIVPELSAPYPLEGFSNDSECFHLSTSQLFPDYIGRLDVLKVDLEKRIAQLAFHKAHVDATYKKYIQYHDNTQEQHLSRIILDDHIGHFHDSIMGLYHSVQLTKVGILATAELQNHLEDENGNSWKDFMAYCPLGKTNNDSPKPKNEVVLSARELFEMVDLMFSESKRLATKYWDDSTCALFPDEYDLPTGYGNAMEDRFRTFICS